jgi:glycosyltransferase involved in cell wall biosynthesis
MKVMLFIAGQEMQVIIARWAPIIPELSQDFIITPFASSTQKTEYKEIIFQIQQNYKKIKVFPIYLKSPDSRFRNLLNPYIMLNDFSSIFKVLLRSRPDVIVCFYLTHAYPLVILRRILKFSLCGYAMGDDVNITSGFFDRVMKQFVYRGCDMIFAVANDLKKKIEKVQSCKVTVIPHGVNPEFFKPLNSKAALRQKWGIKPQDIVILTVCRLAKNKGVEVLIKAFRILNSNEETDRAFKLLVSGEGAERKALEELSSALGVQENVTFLGFRDMEELLELYNLADLFALASYSEGLPKALLEAMACGCIPVATAVGDVGKVVVDGFNGYTVNSGDHEEFSERIKQGISLSEDELTLMQSRARLAITDDFDARKQIKRMAEIINTVYLTRNRSMSTTKK